MLEFLVQWLVVPALSFALGYWVSSHPTDARNIAQKARDAFGRVIAAVGDAFGRLRSRFTK